MITKAMGIAIAMLIMMLALKTTRVMAMTMPLMNMMLPVRIVSLSMMARLP